MALAIEADEDAVATTQVLVEVELDHEAGTETQTEIERDALVRPKNAASAQLAADQPLRAVRRLVTFYGQTISK